MSTRQVLTHVNLPPLTSRARLCRALRGNDNPVSERPPEKPEWLLARGVVVSTLAAFGGREVRATDCKIFKVVKRLELQQIQLPDPASAEQLARRLLNPTSCQLSGLHSVTK